MSNITRAKAKPTYPLMTARERLSIWEQARGMWRHRKPDALRELKKIRREWERRLPARF